MVKHTEAKAILDEYIEGQGKRKTPERYTVMDIVLDMDGHHSADEICTMMPPKFPVSRATVYSTLSLLDEVGLVFSHQVQGKTLYEAAFGSQPHHHYICKGCGRIWDLVNKNVEEAAATCRTPRFKKMRCSVYIYGICNVCYARIYRLNKKLEKQRIENMTREEKRFARIDKELAESSMWLKAGKKEKGKRKTNNEK
ncbi:MAG: transcriptional repressor [Bacteroidaceae bacterium]|jgi:Fe2+ or Zn2+ uptake regulation protein|nr:transcriptional repressor [Bacteroidaceae bacterium]